MRARQVEKRYRRLLENLAIAELILNSGGEQRWGEWLAVVRKELENRDGHGLERLVQAYGGMGSLNDVYVSVGSTGASTVANHRWDALRSAMYDDAAALLRDLRTPS
jgi:hypothetical protein